ncbi:ABC transporter substrate-binding protein [Sphingobacterium sp. lm-10]|uniref:siderophore ABC transporter substrate-binding protein n=1 Tax=Sphingobacterium sp. lm-10 TaxID=2944904 RepID=UPI0020202B2B|nr:ABC transporter substrate-binding protein [Sphingobacterium sp. lm-10]MCL7988198.1 ABC transporter substrate-binding protein [Sphingobacterium sp. lm-10]
MKNFLKLTTIACFVLTIVSCNNTGSSGENTSSDSTVISHKLGNTTIYGQPTKIVVFDFGSLETLNELGVKPVAIPKNYTPDHLAALKEDAQIEDAGGLMEPNFEKINSLAPDLIIISPRQERFYDEFIKIAPTVFVDIDNNNYMKSFEDNSVLLGKLIGKEEAVKEKVAATKEKLKQAQEQLKDNAQNALIAMHNNGRFSVYGAGSRFGFIHAELGVKPAVNQLEEATHGQKVSNEFIVETDPDYLFIVDRNEAVKGKGADKSEIENKLIQQTKAYKKGHIIYLNPQVWYLSGGGITSTNMMIDEALNVLKKG